MGTKFREVVKFLESKLPLWLKALVLIVAVFTTAYTAVDAVVEVPMEVHENTRFRQDAEPLLKYLTCRSVERDAGRDTGACKLFLHDSPYYQEFIRLGIVEN